MNPKNPENDIKIKVKRILSEYLGIEPDDISEEDSLIGDLHMKPSDLTDFLEILETEGINTSSLDLTEIETFAELIEELGDNYYLG